MKVLIGSFTTESNGNIPLINTIANYDILFDRSMAVKMSHIDEIFDAQGIEYIPSILAAGGPSGVISRDAFDYIESCFIKSVKEHINEIDGMFLWLHGASEVVGLGSGDHHILKEIRKIVGPYLPIFVVCDPHGNLTKEYAEGTTYIRCFRESPHTDMKQTYQRVAYDLCQFLKNRQNIHSIYRKLPLILGGEQSVSTDEPVASINRYLDELEKDERVLSASFHVGYIRHDCYAAGCGLIVVPTTEKDIPYCEKKADELYDYIFAKRHEFHYTGYTALPDQALEECLKFNGKPTVLTDSGDNTSSGATGWNTYVLRQVLAQKDLKKSVLFGSITDPVCYEKIKNCEIGEKVHISLGMNQDELSKAVEMDVIIKAKGDVCKNMVQGEKFFVKVGEGITVEMVDKQVTIIITNHRQCYSYNEQFEFVGIKDWTEYDLVVVKQGYIFPDEKEKAAFYVMSLTEGATLQNTAVLPFKRIMRPMFPIDNI